MNSYDNNQNAWSDTQPKAWRQGMTVCSCTKWQSSACIRAKCLTNYYMRIEINDTTAQDEYKYKPGPIIN